MAVTNPFTGGSAALSDVPVELQPQLQQANRQQQMANLLLQQGMSGAPQGQMVSGRYVAPSWSQNLAPIANAALGLYAGYQADKAQTDLAAALRDKQEEIMTKWATATPAEKFALGTSPYAPKALQAATWERLKPQKLGEGDVISEYDIGKGTYTPTAEGGIKMSGDVRTAAQLLGITKPISQWTPQDYAAVNQKANERERAKGTVVNIPNFMEKTFGGAVAEDQAKKFNLMQGVAQNAPITIGQIQNQRKILDSGKFFSGPTANVQQDMALYADALGLGGKDTATKAANTQSLITGAADSTLNSIATSGLGSGQGFTDKDLRFLQDAKSFRITMNKENIKRVLDLQEKAVLNTTNMYNNRLKSIPKSTVESMGLQPVSMPNSDLFNAADEIIKR